MLDALLLASALVAQSAEAQARSAINEAGQSCARVTRLRAIGTTDTGTPLIAAACTGGERYVLEITPRDTFGYLMTCSTFRATTGVSCF